MASWQVVHGRLVEPSTSARRRLAERELRGELEATTAQRAVHADGLERSAERPACSVLVVEGSAGARSAIAELLREYGHDVHTASCMQEMESVCRELVAPPELAFLEFRLRDGRGDQAAAQLRARWPRVFILYFSCVRPADDEALRSALRAPGTALLFKPTSLDAILQVVRRRPGGAARRS